VVSHDSSDRNRGKAPPELDDVPVVEAPHVVQLLPGQERGQRGHRGSRHRRRPVVALADAEQGDQHRDRDRKLLVAGCGVQDRRGERDGEHRQRDAPAREQDQARRYREQCGARGEPALDRFIDRHGGIQARGERDVAEVWACAPHATPGRTSPLS